MLERLGRVAQEARRAAGRKQIDVAVAADVSHAVISRLEAGKRWPRDVDRVVVAYESECGLGRDELWQRAVDLEKQ